MEELLKFVKTNVSYIITIVSLFFGLWQLRLNWSYKKKSEIRIKRYDLYINLLKEFNKLDNYLKNYYLKISPNELEYKIVAFEKRMNEEKLKNERYKGVFKIQEDILKELLEMKKADENFDSSTFAKMPEFEKYVKRFKELDLRGYKEYETEIITLADGLTNITSNLREALPDFDHSKEELSKIFSDVLEKIIQTPNLRIDSSKVVFKNIGILKNRLLKILQIPYKEERNDEYEQIFKSILKSKDKLEDLMTKELKK